MPSNITQRSVPYIWSSANDDIIFEFDFKPLAIDSITNHGGFALVNCFTDFSVLATVGEKLFIFGSQYNGLHTITQVFDINVVKIDAPYDGSVTSLDFNCYHLRIPEFNLYKGSDIGEFAPVELPIELVTPIVPIVSYDSDGIPYISINVKALTSRMFKPESFTPTVFTGGQNIDYNIFNFIRFRWDDQETLTTNGYAFVMVLYSALTNDELRLEFLQNGRYLCPTQKPIIPTSGVAWFSYMEVLLSGLIIINPGFPVIHKFVDGVKQ